MAKCTITDPRSGKSEEIKVSFVNLDSLREEFEIPEEFSLPLLDQQSNKVINFAQSQKAEAGRKYDLSKL